VARQNAAQQAGRRPGIAHIEHIRWFYQTANPAARNPPGAVGLANHLGTKRAHGGCGTQHVLAFK
jgi:hypothetical protein